VLGWTPDSRAVLFASSRGDDFTGKLYTVSIDGGMERNAGADMGMNASYSPDGKKLAINRKGQVYWRKYYRGAAQSDIVVMDIAAKTFKQVTDFDGHDSWPMWGHDGGIYFVSDREGNGLTNIWRVSEDGGKAERITSFKTGDVRWTAVSGDGRVIVFEHDFGIWKLDVATRKTRMTGEADPFPMWETMQPLVAHASLAFGLGALVLLIALALRPRVRTSSVAPGIVALAMLAVMPDVATALGTMSAHRSARAVAAAVMSRLGTADVLAHEGPIEQSGALEWYSGRRPVIVDGRRSVLAFGATRPESVPFFWTAAELERAWRRQRVWIVTTRSPAHSLAARLPGARLIGTFGGRWLYGPPESP